MHYEFPHHMHIDEVRSAIATHNANLGSPVFFEADRGDYSIFNYAISVPGGFPFPNTGDPALDRMYAIIRECRGLIMCKHTGNVLARRLTKFFNINEREDTQIHAIDWSQPHVVLSKLDGSFISPWQPINSEILWGTKMGESDMSRPVLSIVSNDNYTTFAKNMINHGLTPILEWVTRRAKIVIDYCDERLVLLAIRNNVTGEYVPYDDMVKIGSDYGIPVVEKMDFIVTDPYMFVEDTQKLEGVEGYVIRFDNGFFLKQKSRWYVDRHGAKDAMSQEKNIWKIVLEDTVDDFLSIISDDQRDALVNFQTDFLNAIVGAMHAFIGTVEQDWDDCGKDRKTFALEKAVAYDSRLRSIAFNIVMGKDGYEMFRDYLLKQTSRSTTIEANRDLVGGIKWFDYYAQTFGGDDN